MRRSLVLLALVVGAWLLLGQRSSARDEPNRAAEQPASDSSAPRARAGAASPSEAERAPATAPPEADAWSSPDGCRAALARRSSAPTRPLALGAWNVRWFPDGKPGSGAGPGGTDLDWLACSIALLGVDVLAVQEFKDTPSARGAARRLTEALGVLTGGSWRLALDDCGPRLQQHVGLLYDERRVEALGFETLGSVNPHGAACEKQLRPGLLGRFRARGQADAPEVAVISVHLKSGTRRRDYDLRRTSLAALQTESRRLALPRDGRRVVVLGDFNTMGCRHCSPALSAETELRELDAALGAAGLDRLPAAPGCTEYHRSHAGLLDHIAVSNAGGLNATVGGLCAALACGTYPARAEPLALRRLSDHCPLSVVLPP